MSDTRNVKCPRCDMTGSVRGVKHHYTSIHNDGESGGLYITHVPVLVPVVIETEDLEQELAAS